MVYGVSQLIDVSRVDLWRPRRSDLAPSLRLKKDILLRHLHSPHFHQVLRDFRYSLLALVGDEIRPVDEFRMDLKCQHSGAVEGTCIYHSAGDGVDDSRLTCASAFS